MADIAKSNSYFTADFGDGEHSFALPFPKLVELEETLGKSLIATFNAMTVERAVAARDAREIVRLALIGGGATPAEALAEVRRYVEDRPIAESFELAATILESALFGSPKWQEQRSAA